MEEWDREEEFEKHGSSKDPERGGKTLTSCRGESSKVEGIVWAGQEDPIAGGLTAVLHPTGKGAKEAPPECS